MLFPILMGNMLEWFDFILLVYLIDEIALLFFPQTDLHITALLKASSLFALGFIGRPFGSLLLGYYADQWGRKKILLFSTAALALSTTALGLLPTYASIGLAAPCLLAAIRFLQGFCISGELNTSTAYLVEHTNKEKHGFVGSLLIASSSLGICLAAICSFALHHFFRSEILFDWGWRLPFLIGGCMGGITFLLRLRLQESPTFANTPPQSLRTHFHHVWNYRHIVIPFLLLCGAPAVSNYFLSGYFNVFLRQKNLIGEEAIFFMSFLANAFTLVCYPLAGYWADRIGKIRFMKISAVATAVLSLLIFIGLQQSLVSLVMATQCLFAIVTAPLTSLITVVLAEHLPKQIRTTIANFSYNTGMMLFGGSATFISLWLTQMTHSFYAPGFYLIAMSALAWFMLNKKFKDCQER